MYSLTDSPQRRASVRALTQTCQGTFLMLSACDGRPVGGAGNGLSDAHLALTALASCIGGGGFGGSGQFIMNSFPDKGMPPAGSDFGADKARSAAGAVVVTELTKVLYSSLIPSGNLKTLSDTKKVREHCRASVRGFCRPWECWDDRVPAPWGLPVR